MASFNPQVAEDIFLAFPTPLHVHEVPDHAQINPGLRAAILERARADSVVDHSNVGGWRSSENVFDWPMPEIDALRQHVGAAISRLTAVTNDQDAVNIDAAIGGWANVLFSGGYNLPHTHPTCMWSGVYYVDLGEHPEGDHLSGIIEFVDPRAAVSATPIPGNPFDGRFKLEPAEGLMVVFPSWLLHYVHTYRGDRPRISIAFNVRDVQIVQD